MLAPRHTYTGIAEAGRLRGTCEAGRVVTAMRSTASIERISLDLFAGFDAITTIGGKVSGSTVSFQCCPGGIYPSIPIFPPLRVLLFFK